MSTVSEAGERASASSTASRVGLVALLSAHIVSMLGSIVTTVAVPWLVLVSTGSAAKMGLISAAAVFPSLLAGVFGTPLADRFGIRRTMIVAECAAALAMVAVAATPDIGFLPLAALVAVKGALTGLGGRAQHVLLRPVSDAAGMKIIRTTAIYDGTGNLAMVTGAPLGGLLIFWLGPQGAIWFDAASFALSALLVALLVHPPADAMPDRKAAANERYLPALRRGFGHLWQDRLLVGMLVMTSVINLFTVANYAVFVPLWVDEHFGAAPAVGLILSAFACGAIVGNIAFTVFGPKLPQYLTFSLSLVLCVAPRQLTLGLTDSLVAVLVVSLLCGVTQAAFRPILGAMLYARVPVDLQNRVFGMVNAVTGSSLAFGGTLAGLAVAGVGLQPAILVSGSLCLLITLIPLLRYRPSVDEQLTADAAKSEQKEDGRLSHCAGSARSPTPRRPPARSRRSSSPERKAMVVPLCTTRPRPTSRPGLAGRRKLTLSSRVVAYRPASSVAASAGPMVSSSIAVRKPPCTVPAGLRKSSVASKETSISPRLGIRLDQRPAKSFRRRRHRCPTLHGIPESACAFARHEPTVVHRHGEESIEDAAIAYSRRHDRPTRGRRLPSGSPGTTRGTPQRLGAAGLHGRDSPAVLRLLGGPPPAAGRDARSTSSCGAARGLSTLPANESRIRYVLYARTVPVSLPHPLNPLPELCELLNLRAATAFAVSHHGCAVRPARGGHRRAAVGNGR